MKIICFDVDDTLIDTDYKFELTFCDCIKAILTSFETRAPQIDTVLNRARELDNHKLQTYPLETRYQPQRLYDTWLETYAQLCEEYGGQIKQHIKMQIKGIIGQNFDAPWYVIPGAVETVEAVGILPDTELHALTVGDPKVQNKKLTATQLDRYFKHIEVTSADKQPYLEKMAAEFGKENVTMVGNSLSSDIKPALRAGVKAIHIPRGNWHHHQNNASPDAANESIVIKDIRELPEVLQAD